MANLLERLGIRKASTPLVDAEAIRAAATLESAALLAAHAAGISAAHAAGRSEALTEVSQALTRVSPPDTPLGLMPGVPEWKQQHGAYAFNNAITYSTPQAPYRRPKALVSLETLRQLADTYDPLRSCINHLKREVRTVPFAVVGKKGKTPSDRRIAQAETLFARAGGVGGYGKLYRHFESSWIEDALVIGGAAIFHERSRGGEWLSCESIDSLTIRPVVDGYGWSPTDPGVPAYEQWVYGVLAAQMTRADLTYDGLHAVSHSPYFLSPVEWLVRTINSALYADAWNSAWLTDGNTPGDVYSLPEAWDTAEVIQFAAWWNALQAGVKERNQTRFTPGGTKNIGNPSRKDQDFQAFELWLLRRTCSIMGVQPASIGYVGEQYKVSQDASMDQTSRFGAGDLLTLRKSLLDDILDRNGFGDMEVVDTPDVAQDEASIATARATKIGSGQLTINEARAEDGLEPVEGGDAVLVASTLTTLDAVVNPPAPPTPVSPADPVQEAARADLGRWEAKAVRRLKDGKSALCPFESEYLPAELSGRVFEALTGCESAPQVRAIFKVVREEL